MFDYILAFTVATIALLPFIYSLYRYWRKIKPLTYKEILWFIPCGEPYNDAVVHYLANADLVQMFWKNMFAKYGTRWSRPATFVERVQLKSKGFTISSYVPLTRSQVQDLLLFTKPAVASDMELLTFFNVVPKHVNAWNVKYHSELIKKQPKLMETWFLRPGTLLQKECFRFFDHKVPKHITYEDAQRECLMLETLCLTQLNTKHWQAWLRYMQAWTKLQESTTWNIYAIKKPSSSQLRKAIDSLRQSEEPEWDATDVIAQRVIDLYPDLDLELPKSVLKTAI